ncbi:MAG: pseudouridine synthase [Deltaproteobacteria bacterium]|nr:MAG: pseudouridine synthase [Deltaproteobacteria bacterium]
MTGVRLQKFLSEAGVCSRREGETRIRNGRVAVNGLVVTEMGRKIDPLADTVTVDGKPVKRTDTHVYLAMNKPTGVLTTCKHRHPGDRIILDFLDIPQRVVPVGRLDKQSSGLILLTNDGALHHQLSHPSFDHEKEYRVTAGERLSERALKQLETGVVIQGKKTRKARVFRETDRRFRMVLREGRNRQIRRMVKCVGSRVEQLERIRIVNIRLGRLAPGTWRHLTRDEVDVLLKQVRPLRK